MSVKTHPGYLDRAVFPRCDELLSRSRAVPVSLFIRYSSILDLWELNRTGFLDRLNISCKGIELLPDDWDADTWDWMDVFLRLLCKHGIVLDSFSIIDFTAPDEYEPPPPPPSPFYTHMTNVHILLERLYFNDTNVMLTFPSVTLRRLILDTTYSYSTLGLGTSQFATDFPHLEELYIHSRLILLPPPTITEESSSTPSEASVQVPHLRTLCILTDWNNKRDHTVQILRSLVLPSLSEVICGFPRRRCQFPHSIAETLEDLFARSQCRLKDVGFYNAEVDWAVEWIGLLRETQPDVQLRLFDRSNWHIRQVKEAWYH
ncbi:hypothetical protein CONPUDRAFT_162813 [Coniophora puteana RWD-64-598 SS2]|uniref:F-box domain-containing protein n=1 Tax=Coniophora puteana (strain RWD-64-598) TaxID=741705 RepID=A0A5M3N2Z4_CONPW|nr:uncharacterized protein CONPUDRAFT_162813 [Coniophora puteana RWD-64-598 SS2]EIW85657.1 hypothetical protein CONPUDRAFT_162813 [Coniophora puteana RWD-64-598 SS2]